MYTLDSEDVMSLYRECLASKNSTETIEVEGIRTKSAFDTEKIIKAKPQIRMMLNELPAPFFESTGGGYSFLAACNDKNDRQWADLHSTMETLFTLGLACGYVTLLLPRDMWHVLPGGVPYYMISDCVREPHEASNS